MWFQSIGRAFPFRKRKTEPTCREMGRHSFDDARAPGDGDGDASFAGKPSQSGEESLRERLAAAVAGLRHTFVVAQAPVSETVQPTHVERTGAEHVARGKQAESGGSTSEGEETDGKSKEGPPDAIRYVSEGLRYVTGWEKDSVLGSGLQEWLKKTLVKDDERAVEQLCKAVVDGTDVRAKVLARRKDGSQYWCLLQVTPLWSQNVQQVGEKGRYLTPRGQWMLAHMIVWDTPLYRDIMLHLTGFMAKKPAGLDKVQAYRDDVSYTRMDDAGLPTFVKYAKHVAPLDGEKCLTNGHAKSSAKIVRKHSKPPPLAGPGMNEKDAEAILKIIQKQHSFVMSNATVKDCPIAFISKGFTELTGYTLGEVIGKNCRFLQGALTNPRAVREIREAIAVERECMVRLLNYKKNGKPFWNMFNISPVFGPGEGRAPFLVGVQMDVGKIIPGLKVPKVEDPHKALSSHLRHMPSKIKRAVAEWDLAFDGKVRRPCPHQRGDPNFELLKEHCSKHGNLAPQSFVSIQKVGSGDVGTVYLVHLKEGPVTSLFALKALDKKEMIKRQKAARVLLEHRMLDTVDHPFLPTLYAAFQTSSSLYFLTNYCEGGDLFGLLQRREKKRLDEDTVRLVVAQVVLAFQHLHLHGCIFRDLKPENILIHQDGHVVVTDFDLSHISQPSITMESNSLRKLGKMRGCCNFLTCGLGFSPEIVVARPTARTNSFVGTEEYIPPETIRGLPHDCSADWWTLGIFTYEILYGRSPFLGERREETFSNILSKPLRFPLQPEVEPSVQSFIAELLQRDPSQRLGSKHGAEDVKASAFLECVDWRRIRDRPALPVLKTSAEKKGTQHE